MKCNGSVACSFISPWFPSQCVASVQFQFFMQFQMWYIFLSFTERLTAQRLSTEAVGTLPYDSIWEGPEGSKNLSKLRTLENRTSLSDAHMPSTPVFWDCVSEIASLFFGQFHAWDGPFLSTALLSAEDTFLWSVFESRIGSFGRHGDGVWAALHLREMCDIVIH